MKKETVLTVLKDIRTLLKGTIKPVPVLAPGDTRFTKLSDGWVKDGQLGIDWGQTYTEKMTWKEALDRCKKDGFRLPTPEEMSTLINRSKYNPAIVDGAEILDMKTDDWYWTLTPCAWDSGSAWYVGFGYGSVYYVYEGGSNYVRPVRSSQ